MKPEIKYIIPMVPNYIFWEVNGKKCSDEDKFDIGKIPTSDLEEIADEWKKKLIKRATELKSLKND